MKIVIAGASGLLGTALQAAFRAEGHDVHRLVRRATAGRGEISWNPATGEVDLDRCEGADAFINLAGENIAHRWTATRRERILRSRVEATRTLVAAMACLRRRPAVFLSASAVGFYGDCGDAVLTEASAIGRGFLPEVCLTWETHARVAERSGIRTVLLRFGTVLAREGGALAKMLPIFRLGLGGRLGSGEQWMSWIGLDDVTGVVTQVLRDPRISGPINVVAPGAVTQREFAAVLGRVLRRPALLPVPAFALRFAFGAMADAALLASTRVLPQRLTEAGYTFRQRTLEAALTTILAPKT